MIDADVVDINVLGDDVSNIDVKFLTVVFDLRPDDVAHGLHDFPEGMDFVIESHFAAFDLGHVEHIVNQAKELLAGNGDLAQAVLHALGLVHMGFGDFRESDNGVHRRSDVVTHV